MLHRSKSPPWFREYLSLPPTFIQCEQSIPVERSLPDSFALGLSDEPLGRVVCFKRGEDHLKVKQSSELSGVRVSSLVRGRWRRRFDGRTWSEVISKLVREGWRSSGLI